MMQTLLGANGTIATELAKELKLRFTSDIRLVSRTPQKVNDTDQLLPADLLDADQTDAAVNDNRCFFFEFGEVISEFIQWYIDRTFECTQFALVFCAHVK